VNLKKREQFDAWTKNASGTLPVFNNVRARITRSRATIQ
jgi:hypothetical protein